MPPGLGLGLGLGLGHSPIKGGGVPTPPSGFVFLTDNDGAYLIDQDGRYLVEPV